MQRLGLPYHRRRRHLHRHLHHYCLHCLGVGEVVGPTGYLLQALVVEEEGEHLLLPWQVLVELLEELEVRVVQLGLLVVPGLQSDKEIIKYILIH